MTKNILVLAGANPEHNLPWTQQLEVYLKDKFPDYTIHTFIFNHWKDSAFEPDATKDAHRLNELLTTLDQPEIIAKSYGTVVTLESLKNNPNLISNIILMGLPLNPKKTEDKTRLDEYLKKVSNQILFVQQENDKYVPAAPIGEYLVSAGYPTFALKQIPGSDHRYDEFEQYV